MADGFYTNDDDVGSFGGYGSDGAETDESVGAFDGHFGNQPVAERTSGSGGYGFERLRRFVFRPPSRRGCGGDYGRAA